MPWVGDSAAEEDSDAGAASGSARSVRGASVGRLPRPSAGCRGWETRPLKRTRMLARRAAPRVRCAGHPSAGCRVSLPLSLSPPLPPSPPPPHQVLAHLSKTLAGLATVRAFGAARAEGLCDGNTAAYMAFNSANRWLQVVTTGGGGDATGGT